MERTEMSGITNVEFLHDRTRVHYHLGKPYGIPDEDGVKDVPFDKIDGLPIPPESVGFGYGNWNEEVLIPGLNKKIVFMFDSYPEKSYGPYEEDICGPFLSKETSSENRHKIYEAIKRFQSKIDGMTAGDMQDEAEKELRDALSWVPRFKDLTPFRIGLKEEVLKRIRSIASDVFSSAGMGVPSDEILEKLFTPGMFYNDGIWVARDSFVDSTSILLPPVMVGKGSDVYQDAILGPWSCIENSTVIGYSIKGILGNFDG